MMLAAAFFLIAALQPTLAASVHAKRASAVSCTTIYSMRLRLFSLDSSTAWLPDDGAPLGLNYNTHEIDKSEVGSKVELRECDSEFMGYSSTSDIHYGHIQFSDFEGLGCLSVGIDLESGSPFWAVMKDCMTEDTEDQLMQYWSFDSVSKNVTFLGITASGASYQNTTKKYYTPSMTLSSGQMPLMYNASASPVTPTVGIVYATD